MNRRTFLKTATATAGACSILDPRSLRAAPPVAVKPLFRAFGVASSLRRAAELKDAGADYVEDTVPGLLMPDENESAFEASLALVRNAPIPARACNVFLPGSHRATGPDADHAKVLSYATTAFARAQRLGVTTIVFGSSGSRRLPDGFPREQAVEQFVELLKQMGPIAADHGIVIAVEPLNYGECNFLNTIAQGLEIATAVDHPNVGLTADIFHMMRNEEDPRVLVRASQHIVHAHVAEKEKRSAPGVAGDDFTPCFRALRQGGYDGLLSIEASNWSLAELAAAFKAIRAQSAEA